MKSNYLSRKTFQLFQNSIDPDYDGHIPISPLCDIRHSSFHGDSPSSCPQTISEYVAVDLSGFLLPCFFLFLSNCFFLSFFPSFFLSFYLSFFTFFFVCPSLLFYHSLVRILFICFLHQVLSCVLFLRQYFTFRGNFLDVTLCLLLNTFLQLSLQRNKLIVISPWCRLSSSKICF